MKHYSAEEIMDVLRSIKNVQLDEDGCLEVEDKDGHKSYITSFEPYSFIYDLMCLIEEHMTPKIQITECNSGWSFTDGSKWYFYAYSTFRKAKRVYDRVTKTKEGWSKKRIELNIRYDKPMEVNDLAYPL